MKKVRYAELTPGEFAERLTGAPIAYLPLGTLEWHGKHLPLGSDGIQSAGFFERLATEAGGIVLPTLFLGPDRRIEHPGGVWYGMDYCRPEHPHPYKCQQLPGSAYWVPAELFGAILHAALEQLARAGFRIVVAHGHGPSTIFFRDHAREWQEEFGLKLFHCWDSESDSEGLGLMVDHAAKNETSLVMALRPELVQMENLGTDLSAFPVGVGGEDPRVGASAEFGERAISRQLERMKGVLRRALSEVGPEWVR